jgi:hypothetical protein
MIRPCGMRSWVLGSAGPRSWDGHATALRLRSPRAVFFARSPPPPKAHKMGTFGAAGRYVGPRATTDWSTGRGVPPGGWMPGETEGKGPQQVPFRDLAPGSQRWLGMCTRRPDPLVEPIAAPFDDPPMWDA